MVFEEITGLEDNDSVRRCHIIETDKKCNTAFIIDPTIIQNKTFTARRI